MGGRIVTDRLSLAPLDPSDEAMVRAVYAIQSDPDTWEHLPEGRETDISQSRAFMDGYARSWQDRGLGWWAATLLVPLGTVPAETLVGVGGCGVRLPQIPAWNLGYRFTPAVWGHGLAGEIGRAAIAAAGQADPEIPIVARALTRNPASWHVLERIGLSLQWEGSVEADDSLTTGLMRRVYADRSLSEELLEQLIALG